MGFEVDAFGKPQNFPRESAKDGERMEDNEMTEAQERAKQIFESVKDKAEVKKLARSIEQYHFTEEGWTYDFYTMGGELKRVEAFNHRELIEVQF